MSIHFPLTRRFSTLAAIGITRRDLKQLIPGSCPRVHDLFGLGCSQGTRTCKHKKYLLMIHQQDLITGTKCFYLVIIENLLVFKMNVIQLMAHHA